MSAPRADLAELFAACNAAYRVLGEGALTRSEDACVVRVYEAARAFGEIAAELRDALGGASGEDAAVARALSEALEGDDSGERVLEVVAEVVGPGIVERVDDLAGRDGLGAGVAPMLARARVSLVVEILAASRLLVERPSSGDLSSRARRGDLARRLDDNGDAQSGGVVG